VSEYGSDLLDEPLQKRRARLPELIESSGLMLSKDLPGRAADIAAAVRAMGLEGVIAKRKDSIYEPGERSGAWQKLKLELQQEFVIPTTAMTHIAIQEGLDGKFVTWMEQVTDEQYLAGLQQQSQGNRPWRSSDYDDS
jgi:hypothetical protein